MSVYGKHQVFMARDMREDTSARRRNSESRDLTPNELTLDQLTEWDLRFTREFTREMYTRVRENSRSMYVLMREILPILDLLVGENEHPQEYTARIRERVMCFLRDVLPDAQ